MTLARACTWSTVTVFALTVCSCDDSSGSRETQTPLRQYDGVMEELFNAMTDIAQSSSELKTHLEADRMDLADQDIATHASASDSLIAAARKLEVLEDQLQQIPSDQQGKLTQPLIMFIGAGLAIYSLYKFGQSMKEKSQELTAARMERDDALERVGGGTDEADYKEAKDKMQRIGEEVITELTTKVTTDLVLSPVNPSSLGGLILKDKAGDLLERGIKVVTATKDCMNAQSTACRITIQKTSSASKAQLAAGTHDGLLSTQGKARLEIKDVKIVAGADTSLQVDLVPIAQARDGGTVGDAAVAGDASAPADAGAGTDAGQAPSDGGQDSGGLGSVCAQLAACCLAITDAPQARQLCEAEAAKKIESSCSIVLHSSLGRAYGCRE